MRERTLGVGLLLLTCAAVAVAQTGTSPAPATTDFFAGHDLPMPSPPPDELTVRLFYSSLKLNGNESFPVYVEVYNGTKESLIFGNQLFLDVESSNPDMPFHEPITGLPRADSDRAAVVLHLTVPLTRRTAMALEIPSMDAFHVVPGPQNVPGPKATAEPKATMIGRFNLGPRQILQGLNTVQATVVLHGKVIAKGDIIQVQRAPATATSLAELASRAGTQPAPR